MVFAAVAAEGVYHIRCRLEARKCAREGPGPAAAGALPEDDAAADGDYGLQGSRLRRLHYRADPPASLEVTERHRERRDRERACPEFWTTCPPLDVTRIAFER